MKKTKKQNLSEKDQQLAEEYATTARTAARWRVEHAPVHDPKAMRRWLATRKNLPPGTLAKLMDERRTERQALAASIGTGSPQSTGAASTLRRLESLEEASHRELLAAQQQGDPVTEKIGMRRWLDLARELLRFDLAVESSRRDSGELVPKSEVAGHVKALSWALHRAIGQACYELPQVLEGMTDAAEIGVILEKVFGRMKLAAAAGIEAPDWLLEVANRALQPGASESGGSSHRTSAGVFVVCAGPRQSRCESDPCRPGESESVLEGIQVLRVGPIRSVARRTADSGPINTPRMAPQVRGKWHAGFRCERGGNERVWREESRIKNERVWLRGRMRCPGGSAR